jgi:hypothetical protein
MVVLVVCQQGEQPELWGIDIPLDRGEQQVQCGCLTGEAILMLFDGILVPDQPCLVAKSKPYRQLASNEHISAKNPVSAAICEWHYHSTHLITGRGIES